MGVIAQLRRLDPHPRLIGPLTSHAALIKTVERVFPYHFDVEQFDSTDKIVEILDWLTLRHGETALVRTTDETNYKAVWIDPDGRWYFSGSRRYFYFREAKYALEWKLRWY